MSKATVLRGSAARARDKHHTKCTGHSTTPCNKLVNRTCSYRVLLYIPKVISLSGWLLRDDASTFQYYFSKPSFQCFNGIEQPWHSNLALTQPIASLYAVPSTSASSNASTTVTQTSFQAPPRVRVLKKIPRSSRNSAAMKLSAILDGVVAANDTRLLYFASRCLRVPKHVGRRWSLTTQFNRQLNDECDEPLTRFKPPKMMKDNTDLLGDRVSAKLEVGDF